MQVKQNDMSPQEAAEALRWLADMGVDEITGEEPVNRLMAAAARPSIPPAAPPAPTGVAAASTARPAGTAASGIPSAAACMSLGDIEAALAGFDACPLKKTATRLCFADGNPAARVMLVGEAPDRDEDIAGKPFAGKSGQLLDQMLAAIGLSRQAEDRDSAVFITNTIFWRPPGNRAPTEAEIQMCLPFLLRAIALQQPDVIVCLGMMPIQHLTGSTGGLLNVRGKWMTANVSGRNIPVLPTLNPAFLLRLGAQKRLAWRDFLSLRQMLDAH